MRPTWREAIMLEQLCMPTGTEARKFAPIEIPPEVQARFNALSDDERRRLTLEMHAMFNALHSQLGASRSS